MADQQPVPNYAAWFMVEKQDEEGDWSRCSSGRQKWFRVGSMQPHELAHHFGPGTYRATHTAEDRRRRQSVGLPFEISEAADDNTPPFDAPSVIDDDTYSDEQQPTASTPPTDASKTRNAPQRARGATPAQNPTPAARYDMPTMDPRAMASGADPLNPLGQFVYLSSLSQQQADKFHNLLLSGMAMMVDNERARSQEHVANVKAHYEALDKNRSDFMAAVMQMTASKPNGELATLTATVKQLAEQVEDLAEDDQDLTPETLAKLSENPNDLERALAAVQNVIGAVANSPIGAALAERLREAGAPIPPE